MIPEVANLNKCRDYGRPGDMRCDRSTKWGNPFIMYNESQREGVCKKYEKYFEAATKPNNSAEVIRILREGGLTEEQIEIWMRRTGGFLDIRDLKGAKRLLCFCKPLRCHCDYLAKKIGELEGKQERIADDSEGLWVE